MNNKSLVAKANTSISAPIDRVWDALVNPRMIKQYMFGTNVVSDWKAGSPITWKGEWEGKKYEDKGKILELIPGKRLRYNNPTEEAKQHSEKNWSMMLADLKKLLERS